MTQLSRVSAGQMVSEYDCSDTIEDLAPDPVLEATVRRVLLEQTQRQRLREHGFEPIRKVLLTGPPGTGKTLTANVLAGELGETLCVVRTDQIIGHYLGDTGHNLRELFDQVRQKRSVVLIDEFDCIGSARGECRGAADRELNHAVALILQFIEDDIGDSLVLCATNYPQALDHAMFRRFDLQIRYALPTEDQARWLIGKTLAKTEHSVDLEMAAHGSATLCHADIVAAVVGAAKDALLDGTGPVTTTQVMEQLRLRRSD